MFLSYLSNGDEYGEKDHGNEFRGSKNGGREVWVDLEWLKNDKILRSKVAAATVFAGPIRVRPVAAGFEISRRRSSGGGAPPCPAHVQWWWPESAPTDETRMARKRVETIQFKVYGFWGNFSWVFGVGYPLGT